MQWRYIITQQTNNKPAFTCQSVDKISSCLLGKKKQRKIESSDKVAREAIDLQRHNLASSDITNEKSNKDAGTMGLLLHFFPLCFLFSLVAFCIFLSFSLKCLSDHVNPSSFHLSFLLVWISTRHELRRTAFYNTLFAVFLRDHAWSELQQMKFC